MLNLQYSLAYAPTNPAASATNQPFAPYTATTNLNNYTSTTLTTSIESDFLKIAYWNAYGMGNKLLELELYMQRNFIDTMMIIETRTESCRKPVTTNIAIDGYLPYSAVHPLSKKSGGIVIYVKVE